VDEHGRALRKELEMRNRKIAKAGAVLLLAAQCALQPLFAATDGRRVSIDLESVPARELFQALADELGARLFFDESLSGPLSLRVEGVKVTTALDAACDSLGCTWVFVEGERPSLRIEASRTEEARGRGQVTESFVADRTLELCTLSLRDAKLSDVMRTFAKILGCDLDMRSDGSRLVTAEIQNVTVMQALDQLRKLTGSSSSIHRGPLTDQCTLRVGPPGM
jgi:hypothetical protein